MFLVVFCVTDVANGAVDSTGTAGPIVSSRPTGPTAEAIELLDAGLA